MNCNLCCPCAPYKHSKFRSGTSQWKITKPAVTNKTKHLYMEIYVQQFEWGKVSFMIATISGNIQVSLMSQLTIPCNISFCVSDKCPSVQCFICQRHSRRRVAVSPRRSSANIIIILSLTDFILLIPCYQPLNIETRHGKSNSLLDSTVLSSDISKNSQSGGEVKGEVLVHPVTNHRYFKVTWLCLHFYSLHNIQV